MNRRRAGTAIVVALVAGFGNQASAQAAPAPQCDRPEYRQFDYWIGDWNVTSRGQQAGTNRVTLEEGGCLIHEHWTGAAGGTGQSFNFFDQADGKWHQVWISSNGNVLSFAGEYRDGRLAFTGERPAPQGEGMVRHRLTFFRNDDGTVRQLWESSRDGGQSWTTVFDGIYHKKS